MKLRFSGKNVLVLGGSSDLGLELGRLLIQESFCPRLTCRNTTGEMKINAALKEYQGHFRIETLDLSRMDTVTNLFDNKNHDIDCLVDCIHGDFEGLVAAADSRDVAAYFAENISARAEVIKRAGRAMLRKKRGRMIFVSSVAAEKPNPGQGFYAATKLASEALYRNIGLELGERGISAIILRPGYIDAGRGKRYLDSRKQTSLTGGDQIKILTVKEMAETILFFLSDQAEGFRTTTITMDEQLRKIE